MISGAWNDALEQLVSYEHAFAEVGITPYGEYGLIISGIKSAAFFTGIFVTTKILKYFHLQKWTLPVMAAIAGVTYFKTFNYNFFVSLLHDERIESRHALPWLVGLGVAVLLTNTNRKSIGGILIILTLAWSASLSRGVNHPLLVLGPITALLATAFLASATSFFQNPKLVPAWVGHSSILALTGYATLQYAPTFKILRTSFLYRDGPVAQVIEPLDGIQYGAKGIKTNPTTFQIINDMHKAIKIVKNEGGHIQTILRDAAAFWAAYPRPNSLPMDWPIANELPTPSIKDRMLHSLETHHTKKWHDTDSEASSIDCQSIWITEATSSECEKRIIDGVHYP